MGILALLCGLGAFVCQIIVIVKMFQTAGALQAILGFFCGIWAFIWGWMNSDKVGKNVMLAWTALIILYVVLSVLSGGFNYSYSTSTTP
jgi:hypothetical protein